MEPGAIVHGRFEIERLIGAGGMGDVYRARDRVGERTVALKTLRITDDDAARRFAREGAVLSGLSHPHIVGYVDHGRTDDGGHYLAMEWVEGESLAARLAQGPIDEAPARALGQRIAEALAHAHARGIVHRDLKPGNVMLEGGDPLRAKVVDFGIARALSRTVLTMPGGVLGTPGYMAPEQARGETGLDGRADLFSLGCVLFECLVGRPAFVARDALALLFKILVEDPPAPMSLVPALSRDLSNIVVALLEKRADARLPSAALTASRLADARVTPGGPSIAPPTPSPGVTAAEQRLACLVVAGGERGVESGLADTLVDRPREPIRRIAAELGVRVEWLADGGLIAVLSGAGPASDQAAIAARCALAFSLAQPGETFALAIGRAEMRGALPLGPLVDRAVGLLHDGRRRIGAGILCDDTSAQLLSSRFEIEEGRLVALRELPTPQRTLLGRRTPLVGRDRERTRLVELVASSIAEREAAAALVLGPAGIGKSRLLHEVLADVAERAPEAEIWAAGADPVAGRAPLSTLLSAVRRAAGIPSATSRTEALSMLARRAPAGLGATARADLDAFYSELAGGEGTPEGTLRADPMLRADPIRRGFLAHIADACARSPIVLVLEDLHWIDAASLRFLDEALGALADTSLVVIGLARPELRDVAPRLWQSHRLEEIHLPLLRPSAAEKLARHALGADVEPALLARVVSRSTGNPFYLEELIRQVALGRGDALPDTVLAMALGRLESVDPTARWILRAASVLGESFDTESATALLSGSGIDAVELDRWLLLLADEEVLTKDLASSGGYRFRHSYLRDAAYSMLTEEDRARGHRLAAEWLERSALAEPAVIAEHYERAGDPRAANWFLSAARKAVRRSDPDGSITLAARGLVGAEGRTREELIRLQIGTHSWSGNFREVDRLSHELLRGLEPGSRSWWSPAVTALYAAVFLGRPGPTRKCLTTLASTMPALDALAGYARALTAALPVAFTASAHREIETLHPRFLQTATPLAEHDPLVAALLRWIASYHALSCEDDPWAAIEHARAALPALEAGGDTQRALQVRGEICVYLGDLGQYAAHEAENRIVWRLTKHMGLGPSIGLGYLAYNLAEIGRTADARDVASWVFERACRLGFATGEGTIRAALANAALVEGDAALAEIEARRAARLTATVPRYGALGLTVLVRARLALGRPDAALRASRAATFFARRFSPIGATEGGIDLGHAEALRACGHQDEARSHAALAARRVTARAEKIGAPDVRAAYLATPVVRRTLALHAELAGGG